MARFLQIIIDITQALEPLITRFGAFRRVKMSGKRWFNMDIWQAEAFLEPTIKNSVNRDFLLSWVGCEMDSVTKPSNP